MLRPVENKLVLWNVDNKAQATKDPNASLAQGFQQQIQNKKEQVERGRVQKMTETEQQLRIRPDQEKKQSRDQQKQQEEGQECSAKTSDSPPSSQQSGFDFYA